MSRISYIKYCLKNKKIKQLFDSHLNGTCSVAETELLLVHFRSTKHEQLLKGLIRQELYSDDKRFCEDTAVIAAVTGCYNLIQKKIMK